MDDTPDVQIERWRPSEKLNHMLAELMLETEMEITRETGLTNQEVIQQVLAQFLITTGNNLLAMLKMKPLDGEPS